MRDTAEGHSGLTASTLEDLLAEFQQPGQPLHGLNKADAERVFVEVVEQLLLKAIRERRARRERN